MPGSHPDVAFEGRLAWQGCGSTAFAVGAGLRPDGGVGSRRFSGWAELEVAGAPAVSPGEPGSGSGAWGALRSYFAAGGRGAHVLADPRLADGWLGEEGAPGYRSGIHALAELEDVSLLVVVAPLAARSRALLLGLAARRPDLFLLLQSDAGGGEGAGRRGPRASSAGGAGSLRFHAANAAEARGAGTAGQLAGYLERTDFSEEESWIEPEMPPPPPGLERRDLARLADWRRREGLRRSLDRGTRWLLFEAHHPLVWGRAEREVRAFLHRLARAGLVDPAGAGRDFEVRCEPLPPPAPLSGGGRGAARERSPEPGGGDAAGIIIRVRAALKTLSRARPGEAGAQEAARGPEEEMEARGGNRRGEKIETLIEERI